MGKLGINKKIFLHVTLSPDVEKILTEMAYKLGKSKSQVIEDALTEYYKKLKEEKIIS